MLGERINTLNKGRDVFPGALCYKALFAQTRRLSAQVTITGQVCALVSKQ